MLGNLGADYKEEELKARAAAERAALANINPDGGHYNFFESVKQSLAPATQLLGLDRNILGQKIDPNRDPNYHGETAINELQEGLSSAAQNYSNFMSQSKYGRNHLANLNSLAKGVGRMTDYAADEADKQPSNPGEALFSTIGVIGRDLENYSKGAADLLGNLKIGGLGVDPRFLNLITREALEGLATFGAGNFARRGLRILDKTVPPGGGKLMPVPVGVTDDLMVRPPVKEVKPSNVFQTNSAGPRSHLRNPGLPSSRRAAEASKNLTIANKEAGRIPYDAVRDARAAASTNWLRSSLTKFNRKVNQALDKTGRAISEPHHVADHALVGDIAINIGEGRSNILFKNLSAKDIRTGNDGYQMINIPGTKNLGPGSRHDHMKLIHKTYYPQIETRKILTDAIKDGTIKDRKIFSDTRIADLLGSTIRQQQEITIGWAKWKLQKVRDLYFDGKAISPRKMREWLDDHPYEFSKAGAGEAPEHFTEMMKFKATKGQGNYTNNDLRGIFGVEYRPRTLGRSHNIPIDHRLDPEGNVYK